MDVSVWRNCSMAHDHWWRQLHLERQMHSAETEALYKLACGLLPSLRWNVLRHTGLTGLKSYESWNIQFNKNVLILWKCMECIHFIFIFFLKFSFIFSTFCVFHFSGFQGNNLCWNVANILCCLKLCFDPLTNSTLLLDSFVSNAYGCVWFGHKMAELSKELPYDQSGVLGDWTLVPCQWKLLAFTVEFGSV